MPRTTDRPPWCGLGETPEAAAARILAIARQHTTHGETAAALGVNWRTMVRIWPEIVAHAAGAEVPPRPAGGSPERGTKAGATRRARVARIVGGTRGDGGPTQDA